jgi:hypothetical protein
MPDSDKRFSCGHNWNAGVATQDQKVGIAGDDQIGPGGNGQCQHPVIIGIAADRLGQG